MMAICRWHKKMIKQFFGVPEENYTIISVKNELSKEDYYDIS